MNIGKCLSTTCVVLLTGACASTSTPEDLGAKNNEGPEAKAVEPTHLDLPQRTSKHEELQVLEGDWVITGKTYAGSPWGEGEFTAREHNELMKGGMFLVSKTQYSEQFDNSSQIAFFGVDPKSELYTFSMYNNLGVVVRVAGTLRQESNPKLIGNAIVWGGHKFEADPNLAKWTNVEWGGDVMQYTTEVISRDEYRFKMERGKLTTYDGVAKRVNAVQ